MAFDLAEYARSCGVEDPDVFRERCDELYRLLIEANRQVNLTRITEPQEFNLKHIADSLAIARFFPELAEEKLTVADIGCGAGFPSLVLALAFPRLRITAIDSTGKKTAFVERAAAALGLTNLKVVTGRSNELNRRQEFRSRFDIVTARAVAPAPVIYGDADCFIKRKTGRFILYKTPDQAAEDLPALSRLCRSAGIEWKVTESFELPEGAGTRLFLHSRPV